MYENSKFIGITLPQQARAPLVLPFSEAYTALAQTTEGQLLATRVRGERYKPQETTREEWLKVLGFDADNLRHQYLTYRIAKGFVARALEAEWDQVHLTLEEGEDVLFASLTHDIAEAIIGDISYDQKGKQLTKQENPTTERDLYIEILSRTFPEDQYPGIHERITRIADEVIFCNAEANTRALTFNAIERYGYLRAALRAHRRVNREHFQNLRNPIDVLAVNVFSNQIPSLLELAPQFQPVHELLQERSHQITAISQSPQSTFDFYSDLEERSAQESMFAKAREAWITSSYTQS